MERVSDEKNGENHQFGINWVPIAGMREDEVVNGGEAEQKQHVKASKGNMKPMRPDDAPDGEH